MGTWGLPQAGLAAGWVGTGGSTSWSAIGTAGTKGEAASGTDSGGGGGGDAAAGCCLRLCREGRGAGRP